MKFGLMTTSTSQDVSIELEPALPSLMGRGSRVVYPSMSDLHRTHSRSASWSLPGGHGSRSSEFGMGLAIAPITNVIREIVPSFGSLTRNRDSDGSLHVSRDPSQTSLLLGPGGTEVEGRNAVDSHEAISQDPLRSLGNSSSNMNVHLPHEHIAIPLGAPGLPEEQNIGLELSDNVRWLEQNAVFIILLLVRFAWYHRSGLMVILGMVGTFLHCDQVLRKQVALKNHRQIPILLLVVLFLGANIWFIYYVFWEQRLHFFLLFMNPHFTVDMSNLIWSIWVTDCIICFGTMAIKALVTAIFLHFLPTRKKGKYYMLLEYLSQFYRALVPAPLWVRYLSNPLPTGLYFAVFTTSVYLMLKGALIFTSLRELFRAFVIFLHDQMHWRSPTRDELDAVSQPCAICQDQFCRPVMLSCKHIFCENCVLQWLERQNSCPLCRAAVGSHPHKWRDGSTSRWPQIF